MNLSRRHFMKYTLSAALFTGIRQTSWAQYPKAESNSGVILPKRLKRGGTIGIVAPATNAWEDEDIRFAIEVVESLGFKVKQGKHLFDRHGYLAGHDADRAADLNAMFADGEVDGIFCLRGGWGSPRILPMLDYASIKAHPKVIMGYSDITAMLNAIFTKTGLITFHGPIARQSFSNYTLEEYYKVLHRTQEVPFPIGAPPEFETQPGKVENEHRITTITGGKAEGQLVGGNLTLFSELLGTPYFPGLAGKILFLEDINEQPYRIDAMLTQLWLAGELQQCAGVVFAKFTDCVAKNPPSVSLEQIFVDRIKPLGIPCYRGLLSGHVSDQTVVPIGCKAKMDADLGRLTLVESPIS